MFKRREAEANPEPTGSDGTSSGFDEGVGESRPVQVLVEDKPTDGADLGAAEQAAGFERTDLEASDLATSDVAASDVEHTAPVTMVRESSVAESVEAVDADPELRSPEVAGFDPDPMDPIDEDRYDVNPVLPVAGALAGDGADPAQAQEDAERFADLPRPSVWAAIRRSFREFNEDNITDVAAGLTYYAVLSIFPAALALLSLLGLVGNSERYVNAIVDVVSRFAPSAANAIDGPLMTLANSSGAGIALIAGVLVALYSASGYVSAFGRAMNRVYEVDEGRPAWKLKPQQYLITLLCVVLCAAGLMILVLSGPVARAVGDKIGLGNTVVEMWNIAKWPVLLLIVVAVVALLYRSSPNVKLPTFRWVSAGAFVAILVWLAASAGFAFYVANFASYNKTYGSIAGVVVALLWLWITNVALLFGAELDSEFERNRELQLGLEAEEWLQLPMRDDRGVIKAAAKREKHVARSREIRQQYTHVHGDINDRPFD